MKSAAKMALGALLVLFAVGSIGIGTAIAQEEVKMVFNVEGMR